VTTHEQTELSSLDVSWPSWSPDSQYVYFRDSSPTEYRVKVTDRKLERLVNFKNFKFAPSAPNYGWVGLAADGALVSLKDAGSNEIYALNWEAP
jgi:hypothetical protein